jgi:hypothetical protein
MANLGFTFFSPSPNQAIGQVNGNSLAGLALSSYSEGGYLQLPVQPICGVFASPNGLILGAPTINSTSGALMLPGFPDFTPSVASGSSAITGTTALTAFSLNYTAPTAYLNQLKRCLLLEGWFTATVGIANSLNIVVLVGSTTVATPVSGLTASATVMVRARILVTATGSSGTVLCVTETVTGAGIVTIAETTTTVNLTTSTSAVGFAAQWTTANADSVTNDLYALEHKY